MIRLIWRTLIFLGSAAVGLLAATLILDDMHVEPAGFVVAVLIYAVIQSVIQPFITKMAALHASAFLGGTALAATLIALMVTTLASDSLRIDGGIGTWLAATVIVWLVTAVATLLLPFVLVRAGVEAAQEKKAADRG